MYTWDWNKKIGYMEVTNKGKKSKLNIYQGNGFAIFINENLPDNQYQVITYWVDETHAKNCLGLSRGYDNIYKSWWEHVEFWLDANYEHCFKIAKLLAKAKINFVLEY